MRIALCLGIAAWIGCTKHAPPPPAGTDLTLVSPGAEPRRMVRYAAPKGSHASLEIAYELDLGADQQGGALPTVVMSLDVAIEDLLPDGRMKVRSTITDASMRDRPGTQITAASVGPVLDPFKGVALTATLSPDGRVTEVKADTGDKQLPEALSGQLATLTATFEQVAMPLPTEPIGVGAKWRTSRAIDQTGMKATTVSTIDVTKLEGNLLSFSSSSEIHGPDQTTVLQGTSVEIKNITGTGTGSGTVDLDKLVMTGEMSSQLSAEMTAQGEKTAMKLAQHAVITAH